MIECNGRAQAPLYRAGRPSHRVLWTLAVMLLLDFAGVSRAPAQELMLSKTTSDLVAESEWIAVADLVGAQPRRNARGNLIVTDYRFRTEQTLEGAPGAEFTLTQGGGTVGGETNTISDAAELETGRRYLVFVRPDRGEIFPPFVGGAQGVYVLSDDGKAMSLGGDRRKLDASLLVDQVRVLSEARGATPPRRPAAGTDHPGVYPAKRYLPIALTPPDDGVARVPEAEPAVAGPAAPPAAASVATGVTVAMRPTNASGPGVDWHVSHQIAPPATINGFPPDWDYYPEDQYLMSDWNRYGGQVFVVATTRTDWAYGNDRFDLAGWPSNDDMIAQFGEGWGASTLGITYRRWNANGVIIEADIALNPAYCWTLDERVATDASNQCWGFRQTMLHELGHAWGLDHPWETQDVWWDSVMNYSPKNDRFPRLHADDTNAVRASFAGPGIHDAALSLYKTSLDPVDGAQSADYTPTQLYALSVHHGDDLAFSLGDFSIENLGTDDIVSPSVDFYLSPARLDFGAGTLYLGSGSYDTLPTFFTLFATPPSLPIPATTPTGYYYLSAYLPEQDDDMRNNSAWADEESTIRVDNNPPLLTPQAYWQLTDFGYIGPGGEWNFEFDGEAGTTYYFSLCTDESGGGANFDTVLSVLFESAVLISNDDSCGLQSSVVFTAPYSVTFTVTVEGYSGADEGTFLLGYREDVGDTNDTIFADGFDG